MAETCPGIRWFFQVVPPFAVAKPAVDVMARQTVAEAQAIAGIDAPLPSTVLCQVAPPLWVTCTCTSGAADGDGVGMGVGGEGEDSASVAEGEFVAAGTTNGR